MYTIDLLKGQGIPIKHRRGGMLFVVVMAAVPLLIFAVLVTEYIANSTRLMTYQNSIREHEKQIAKLAPALEAKASMESQCSDMRVCLGDVAKVVGRNEQWSDILVSLVQNMPATMLLGKLDVRINSITKQTPDRADPNKLKTVAVSTRTLQISLLGDRQSDNIAAVRTYIDMLRTSPELADRVDDIRLVGQEVDKLRDRNMMRYDIDCVFKAQME